jgi:transposase InsO family protein
MKVSADRTRDLVAEQWLGTQSLYGYRKMTAMLRSFGEKVTEYGVRKAMKQLGISGKR